MRDRIQDVPLVLELHGSNISDLVQSGVEVGRGLIVPDRIGAPAPVGTDGNQGGLGRPVTEYQMAPVEEVEPMGSFVEHLERPGPGDLGMFPMVVRRIDPTLLTFHQLQPGLQVQREGCVARSWNDYLHQAFLDPGGDIQSTLLTQLDVGNSPHHQ